MRVVPSQVGTKKKDNGRVAKEVMLFVPRPDKATQHDCVHTWHNDCTPTRTDGRVARVDERKELVPASDCPVVVFQQNICATTNFLLLPPPKNSLGQASTFVVGKPFFILFYMWKEGRAREHFVLCSRGLRDIRLLQLTTTCAPWLVTVGSTGEATVPRLLYFPRGLRVVS